MVKPLSGGRVAAVVPVCDPRFLPDALESVFFQSRPPDEVIVVDHGCADQQALRRAIAPYAPRLELLKQAHAGSASARNAGIVAATADLVAFLDANDRWLSHFVRSLAHAFATDPTLDLAYSNGVFIGASPLAGRTFMTGRPDPVTLDTLLTHGCDVPCSAIVVRRSSLLVCGGFDPRLTDGHGFDLLLRLASSGQSRIACVPQLLAVRRLSSASQLHDTEAALQAVEHAVPRLAMGTPERAAAERRVRTLQADAARQRGEQLLRRGDMGAARAAFSQACAGPSPWRTRATHIALTVAPWLVRRMYSSRIAGVFE